MWVDQSCVRTSVVRADPSLAGRPTGGRRKRAVGAARRATVAEAGEVFAENRIHHAVELFGACMLIVAFLAVAMFV